VRRVLFTALAFASLAILALPVNAQITLLAVGSLDRSRAGALTDLSGLTYNLESGVPANVLGGYGSAITYAGANAFLALPDRGPNAPLPGTLPYDPGIDNTTSYINRFHTVNVELSPKNGSGTPFSLGMSLRSTTLLWSPTALVYGAGDTIVGSGAPSLNSSSQYFFTGRSDSFDSSQNSGNPNNARFDTEGIRLSNDGLKVYISDEYGPYVYEFDRLTGKRLRSFQLDSSFYATSLSSMGDTEISGNSVGRVANKGMEGLAITPDGTTLVGIMQNSLEPDAALKGAAAKMLRIVTIDLASGNVTHQYAYLLTTGTGVSEILALNNQEFLVDERDGKGRGDGSSAKVKTMFKISLAGATDVSGMDGLTAASHAVAKTQFLDLVKLLTHNGVAAGNIPAKIEGVSFGADVKQGKKTFHTLWIANDNDFLPTVADASGTQIPNPNQFFVVGFTDADLGGSSYAPQQVTPLL
jgi:hypothetical protein